MPVFEYSGLTEAGKNVRGVKDAENRKVLRSILRKDGIFLTDVRAADALGAAAVAAGTSTGTGKTGKIELSGQGLSREVDLRQVFGSRVSGQDLAIATRQLATLIGAGITLVDSLTALVEQVEHPRLKRILGVVRQKVNEGSSLADALAEHPKTLYVNMIRAGESSGALDVVLVRLADFTEGQAALRNKILGAMLYPAIMVLVGLSIVAILFVVVIPKVTKIFDDMNVSLPWTTRILIGTSTFARDYWYLILGAIPLFIWAVRRYVRTEGGRAWWDRTKLRAPIFGPVVRMLALARFAKTLATLLSSGVPLLTALDIVKNIVNNSILAKVIEDARDAIREGESIAAPLKRSGQFPPLVHHMIAIGEKSGQLEQMLGNIARSYDSQVEIRVSAMTSLLEPVMIVMMGGGVAFIVFSILMPIMQLNTFVPQ
ncbi:MAG: type II secretion system protein GspF [Deltaproteobacteria bacterium]|nr:MAG: type II secretion system protein GspF [Deltaproteobacteria bacterium]